MEQVDLTFRYTQGEYVKAARQYLFASKTITKTSVVVIALYLPFSILYLFLSSLSVLSIILSIIAWLFSILGVALYCYVPGYQFKKTAKYQEEYHLTFSSDGIEFNTKTIHSELKWDNYAEIWESNDSYYLIQAPQIYTLLPKRAFLSPADKRAFEEIALKHLNCSKRVL